MRGVYTAWRRRWFVKSSQRTIRKTRIQCEALEAREVPADVSAPAVLQWFESTHANIERRLPDFFSAGYGSIWAPPPGRADQGNLSVGYDPYDRFDLGSTGNYTLYGSETGIKTTVREVNRAGGLYVSDFIINHDGFSDWNTAGFLNAGGYPGFWMSTGSGSWGDFHNPSATSDHQIRLAGLIDIAQESNNLYVRSPVPGFANNLPAGTTPAFGRLANVPDNNNKRFYTDNALTPIMLYDPSTGEANIPVYPFNLTTPLNGDPITENAMGYLMRQAQWMVQVIGVDGFRIDAAKHVPTFVMNYFDRAVYRASLKTLLNGNQQNIFSFSEVYDGNKPFLQSYIRKDINPSTPGVIGGNRDVLDFPLFFAMRDNLTSNGLVNSWFNIVNASIDVQDDGYANNGSQGVAFVHSHDNGGAALNNVAHAYMLMRPGNANVYYNAKQFGNGRPFPLDGRGDALGGFYGNAITTLVNIRNGYGRGNYNPRLTEKEILIYERENSALVVLSNRTDGGYDERTVNTAFPIGTPLIELTGNSANPTIDPLGDFPEVLIVNNDAGHTVNLRVPRNKAPGASGALHNNGYFIYGPSAPQGTLTILGSTGTIAAETPTANTNGTALLSAMPVIKGNTFQIKLDTLAVTLPGNIRDQDADGDNALFKIDGGLDFNGTGKVDYTAAGEAYGFEEFTTTKTPGYTAMDGNGTYVQTIDATQLSEGVHYITVRAFRHRTSGPAVYKDFKVAVYIDRTAPMVTMESFNPIVAGVTQNRRVQVRANDLTANNVFLYTNLPAGLTDAQVIALSTGQANQLDRDVWTRDINNVGSGNHVITAVIHERNGTVNVQRFTGIAVTSSLGAGLGDLNFDGMYTSTDVSLFNSALLSNNGQFNPAADFDANGVINNIDFLMFGDKLAQVGATSALSTYRTILGPQTNYVISEGNVLALSVNQPSVDVPPLSFTWDLNNDATFGDAVGGSVNVTWNQLLSLGINTAGSYPIALKAFHGATSFSQTSSLIINSAGPSAAFANNGPVAVGAGNASVSFSAVGHPSPPVQAGGFVYSYDFDNDNTFEIVNSASSMAAVPANLLTAPSRTVHGRVTALGNGLSTDFTTTISVVAPPKVQSITINDGSPQRSRVTSLKVTFDGLVVLPIPPELAFSLIGPGSLAINIDADDSISTPTQTIVELTWSGAGVTGRSLDDGYYSLSVISAQVADSFGQALDGDNDGAAGGDATTTFHRFFGDANGDAAVSGSDFNVFRTAFGGSDNAFDYDDDGFVGGSDFNQFRGRFGGGL